VPCAALQRSGGGLYVQCCVGAPREVLPRSGGGLYVQCGVGAPCEVLQLSGGGLRKFFQFAMDSMT